MDDDKLSRVDIWALVGELSLILYLMLLAAVGTLGALDVFSQHLVEQIFIWHFIATCGGFSVWAVCMLTLDFRRFWKTGSFE